MQHLDEGTIHAWLDGALPPADAAAVDAHARECAECAAAVADARGLIAGAARIVSSLDAVPGGVIPKAPARAATPGHPLWRALHLTPLRAALAASLIVAASSVLVVRNRPVAPKNETTMMSAAAPAAAAAPVAAPAAPLPQPSAAAARPRVSVAERSPSARVDSLAQRSVAESRGPDRAESKVAVAADSSSRAVAPPTVAASAATAPVSKSPASSAPAPASPAPRAASPIAVPASAGLAGTRNAAAVARDVALSEQSLAASQGRTVFVATTSDNRALDLPGCFETSRDSLIVAPGFPTRFALDLDEEKGERRNIVRALNADGRRDSAATAYSWEPTLDASQVRIVTRPGMRSIAALRQEAAVRGARGAAFAPTPSVPVRISRIPCR